MSASDRRVAMMRRQLDDNSYADDDTLREDNSPKKKVDSRQSQSSLNQMSTMNGHPAPREATEVVDGWTVVNIEEAKVVMWYQEYFVGFCK